MKFFYYKVNCFYNFLILEELYNKIHNVESKYNTLFRWRKLDLNMRHGQFRITFIPQP